MSTKTRFYHSSAFLLFRRSSLSLDAADVICHEKTHSAALGQTAGNSASVTYKITAVHYFKIAVMLGTDAVIFIFATVKHGIGICRAGRNLIEGINGLYDICKRSVRKNYGKVSGESLERGNNGICLKSVLVGSSSANKVSESLNDNISRTDIGLEIACSIVVGRLNLLRLI